MTPVQDLGRRPRPRRLAARRRLLVVAAAAGAWAVGLAATAPAALAGDVRSQQWYLDAMQAEKIWKVSTGEGIKIAVVDTGVDDTTDALKGQVLPGKDLSGAKGDENDDFAGHGTSMAEYMVGTGENGSIRGLAPGAKVIPIRAYVEGVKVDVEKGKPISKAIWAAAKSDADIINMSFGSTGRYEKSERAIRYALSKDKLVFASVGNAELNLNLTKYPSAFPGVVGVAAIGKDGSVAAFSQPGRNVDLAAPGVDFPGWCSKDLEKYCSGRNGTSNSTAIASASAALIWAEHPDWTANQVLRVLIDTAGRAEKSNKPSKHIGWGVVRPGVNLLQGKGDPGPADVHPLGYEEPSTDPSASPVPGDENAKGDDKASDADHMDSAASASDDSNLWIYLGAGAAIAAAIAGAAIAVARTRRG